MILAAAAIAASSVPSPALTAVPVPAVTTAPTATPTAPPNAHIWQGITPGDTIAHVHARLGAPLLVRLLPDGSVIDWYPGPSDNAYMIVSTRKNVVTYVRAFPIAADRSLAGLTDPWGVNPGDTIEKLRARRGQPKEGRRISQVSVVIVYDDGGGFLSLYEFDQTTIHAIALFNARTSGPPPAGAPLVSDSRDGVSIGRAYVIQARDEIEGVRFERYYATHRGGCRGWNILNQTLLTIGKRKYDQLDLECVDDKGQTSMFFDVTSFLGK